MELKFKDGTYDGPVKDGVPHGKRGKFFFNNGMFFNGDFKDGKACGAGIIYLDDSHNDWVSSNHFDGFYDFSAGMYSCTEPFGIFFGPMVDGVFFEDDTNRKFDFGLSALAKMVKTSKKTKANTAKKTTFDTERLTLSANTARTVVMTKTGSDAHTPAPPKVTQKLRLKDGNYEGDVKNGKPHGKGRIVYDDGHAYEGDFVDGKRIGKGTLYFVDGDRLECVFRDDYPNGTGTLYIDGAPFEGEFIGDITNFFNCYHRDFKSGSSYSGAFLNGKYHGKGIWDSASGTHYEGEFKYGKYDGYGEVSFSTGAKYMGEFKNGEYHGQGVYRFPDWSNIRGQFRNGKPNGYCEYNGDDGTIYKGEYVDGKWHGKGVLTKADGYKFEGTFENGVTAKRNVEPQKTEPRRPLPFSVEGSLKNQRGDRYEGEHLNGKPHGKGVMRYADGSVYKGEFRDGLPHGRGVYTHPDGERYDGCFLYGKKDAYGKLNFADGSYYEGDFKDGKMQGLGTLYEKDTGWTHKGYFDNEQMEGKGESYNERTRERYVGSFHKGSSHGKGKYYYADGSYYDGEYMDGQWHGKGYYKDSHGWDFEGEFRYNEYDGYGELRRPDGIVIRGYFTSLHDARDATATMGDYTVRGRYVGGRFIPDDEE